MNSVLLVAATGSILVIVFGFVFARLIKSSRCSPAFSDDPQSIFSPERYLEMERLLDVRLSFQEGCTTRDLRMERVKLFRSYIGQLSRDFYSLCTVLKVIMVNSQVDRPDLATILLKQRLLFTCTILSINIKVVLYRLGWSGVGAITGSLRLLSYQLQDLASTAQPQPVCY